MTDNFADHPPSITELRANKTMKAADWTPRDALVELLRAIDNKEVVVDALVIAWRTKDPDGSIRTNYNSAVSDTHIAMGMLANAIQVMATPD